MALDAVNRHEDCPHFPALSQNRRLSGGHPDNPIQQRPDFLAPRAVTQGLRIAIQALDLDQAVHPQIQVQRPHVRPHPTQLHLLDRPSIHDHLRNVLDARLGIRALEGPPETVGLLEDHRWRRRGDHAVQSDPQQHGGQGESLASNAVEEVVVGSETITNPSGEPPTRCVGPRPSRSRRRRGSTSRPVGDAAVEPDRQSRIVPGGRSVLQVGRPGTGVSFGKVRICR